MTVTFLKRMCNTDTTDVDELYQFALDLRENGEITSAAYATVKANINLQNPNRTQVQSRHTATKYTEDEVLTVLKSHLEVYDGMKSVKAHVANMKRIFGERTSQVKNGAQYNRGFHRTLDLGDPNLGQSMSSNWADATLFLIQDRPEQKHNILEACKKIYEATNNQNMYRVIQKWSIQ